MVSVAGAIAAMNSTGAGAPGTVAGGASLTNGTAGNSVMSNGSGGGGQNSATPSRSGYVPNNEQKRAEILRFTASKPLYAAAWSNRRDVRLRLAVGTLVEREQGNRVSIVQVDDDTNELVEKANFAHEYPVNGIAWAPTEASSASVDLLATSSDLVRVWRVHPDGMVSQQCQLEHQSGARYCSPVTALDWNEIDPTLIGSSSIDTTCTVWQIETGQPTHRVCVSGSVKTQLIAHDKPVHDMKFARLNGGPHCFATVGADGSARLFDLRNLEHSTIIYEAQGQPLMRLAWNKQHHHYLATFAQDSNEVLIIDVRMPCHAAAVLRNHGGPVNGIAWAPHSSSHICTAGDDQQALIWDVHQMASAVEDPILAYKAQGEVNQVHWGVQHTNWICICFNKCLEILRV